MPGTRKLGRDTAHRTAMLRAMVTFLLENGKIETTLARAKEVRSLTEKMITLAKENNLHNKRMALAFITKEDVVKKLFDEIAPKYAERNGGYTRINKLGPRRGDAAEMVIIELIQCLIDDIRKPFKLLNSLKGFCSIKILLNRKYAELRMERDYFIN